MKNDIEIGGVAHQAGTVSFRHRPQNLRVGSELQGARVGQSVRRRHQHFPEHRSCQPCSDRDGKRLSRWGSFAPAALNLCMTRAEASQGCLASGRSKGTCGDGRAVLHSRQPRAIAGGYRGTTNVRKRPELVRKKSYAY